jgi:lipopolysaccharide transport system ATP-binding protein
MQPAIRVENLGKRYRLDHAVERGQYKTFRESLSTLATAPFRRRNANGEGGRAEAFWALNDVSFDVQPGEVVGIIGRNGAGKSTLLKVLSRITKPSRGKVTVKGRVGSLLEVGTGFHPELSGRENVYLNGSILGMSRREIDGKFDEIVEFSGVEKFLDTPVKRYSSGMQVRLAFAVAAHLEPEMLLVDEVLAVGDATYQRRCIDRMSKFASSGRTILIVSHNLDLIPRLCTRAILLERGNVRADGPSNDITNQYLSALVEGADDDNLLDKSRSGDGRARFTTLRHVDESGNRLFAHRCGEDMILQMEIESQHDIDDAALAVVIENLHGTRIITSWNEEVGFKVDLRRGRHTYECRFRNVGIRPGHRVNIHLWLASHNEQVDCVPHAKIIEVEHGSNTQHLATEAHQGIVVCDYAWRHLA